MKKKSPQIYADFLEDQFINFLLTKIVSLLELFRKADQMLHPYEGGC